MNKIRVGILFGGQSAEHEVSLQTARNVVDAIDREKYDIVLIGIDKNGKWQRSDTSHFLLNENDPSLIKLHHSNSTLSLLPYKNDKQLLEISNHDLTSLDVIFPLLHGTYGEDGTIQGLLKLAHIPFVGSSVLGSAIAMDKDITKRLLRDANIPVTKFITTRSNAPHPEFSDIVRKIGLPFFIKPANAGSSIGVSKVTNEDEYGKALTLAKKYDNKIMIEKAVKGREIEFAVLGNENPIISVPGEIILNDEFYSYDAKYIDETASNLQIPAKISEKIINEMQQIALKTYKLLECEGMARVDMFLTKDNQIFVNEVNTIPGFTKISMYPKLMQASGIPYTELIDRLIKLARERFARDSQISTSIIHNS
jgi:D-alanine-D-alanine ligase